MEEGKCVLQRSKKNQLLLRFSSFCKKWIADFTVDFNNLKVYGNFLEFLSEVVLPHSPRVHSILSTALDRASDKISHRERKKTIGGSSVPRPMFNRQRSGSVDHGVCPQGTHQKFLEQNGGGCGSGDMASAKSKNRFKIFNRTDDEILNCTSTQIARELTMHDSALFCGIKWWEILDLSCWKEEDMGTLSKKSSNISQIVKYFNHIGQVISSHILSFTKAEFRAKAVGLWLKVGCRCLDMNNFNGAMMVFSGLNVSPISRLKQTFCILTEEDKKRKARLEELLNPHAGFVRLKSAVSNSVPPCIPYLGLYSSDLAYILDGLPNELENGFINYQKYTICASLVLQIRLFQNITYSFEREPAVKEIFEKAETMTEEELYTISLERESRSSNSSKVFAQQK